jgi:glycerol-3-phosphate dehydrogenase
LFSRDTLPTADAAGFIPDADNKRFLFVIPWLDAVVVGTTDTPYVGDLDRPSVESSDRAYCLDALNAIFGLDLDDSDIAGAYAGLRPLIAGKAGATADLSRNHTVYDIAPGILGITGGKLTTYRRMALDAVDRVTSSLDMTAKSRTHWIRLGSRNVGALEAAVQRRAARLGIPPSSVANLVRCYGDRALDVLDVADSTGQTEPLAPGHLPIAAEATYCARAEMVVHLADLLARRTRLALTDHAAGTGRGAVGADILAGELKWGRSTKRAEIAGHRSQIEAERGLRLLDAAPAPPERESTG